MKRAQSHHAQGHNERPQLPPGYVVIASQSLEDATRLIYIPGEIITPRGGRAAVAIAGRGDIIPAYWTLDEARAACWLHFEASKLGRSLEREEWMQPQQGGVRRVG